MWRLNEEKRLESFQTSLLSWLRDDTEITSMRNVEMVTFFLLFYLISHVILYIITCGIEHATTCGINQIFLLTDIFLTGVLSHL